MDNSWDTTPDLSQEFYPNPKPAKKGKASPKPLNKVGKKGKEDMEAREENKKEMEEMGITECEIQFPDICWKNNALTFAHPAKRRKLTKEDLRRVIVACTPCHQVIEKWPAEKMEAFVNEIIKKRDLRLDKK